jgi:hypothetical protein
MSLFIVSRLSNTRTGTIGPTRTLTTPWELDRASVVVNAHEGELVI